VELPAAWYSQPRCLSTGTCPAEAGRLFFDSLPYNAHTTASDALWAGLPLLTCRARRFPAGSPPACLGAIGVPELVTKLHGRLPGPGDPFGAEMRMN